MSGNRSTPEAQNSGQNALKPPRKKFQSIPGADNTRYLQSNESSKRQRANTTIEARPTPQKNSEGGVITIPVQNRNATPKVKETDTKHTQQSVGEFSSTKAQKDGNLSAAKLT